jgi:hypothetical protein
MLCVRIRIYTCHAWFTRRKWDEHLATATPIDIVIVHESASSSSVSEPTSPKVSSTTSSIQTTLPAAERKE